MPVPPRPQAPVCPPLQAGPDHRGAVRDPGWPGPGAGRGAAEYGRGCGAVAPFRGLSYCLLAEATVLEAPIRGPLTGHAPFCLIVQQRPPDLSSFAAVVKSPRGVQPLGRVVVRAVMGCRWRLPRVACGVP